MVMGWSYQVDVEFSLVDADGVHLFDSHPSLLQKRGADDELRDFKGISPSFMGFYGVLAMTDVGM